MIHYSPDARADIISIYRYGFAEFGHDQAESYMSQMDAIVGLLEAQPNLAALRGEYVPPVRIHPWRSHYIVYQTLPTGIYIVRILHGASDLARHL